jgi:glycosyltransferase involved in cell wall biosynthesis
MDLLFFSELSPYLDHRTGGAENSMRLIAEGLAARGHRVTFASLRPDAGRAPERTRQGAVEVMLLPNPRRGLGLTLARRLRMPGLMDRLAAPGWDRVGAQLFEAGSYDLLYAFYETEFLARALAARERTGMAVVMRMAGLAWAERIAREPAARAAIAAVFNGVDAINFLSEASRALVLARAAETGLPLAPRASFVADIGVDVSRTPRAWTGPSTGPGLRLVTATRFSAYQKRQDLLVEALGLLKDRLDVRATLIGDGPRRAGIAARVAALGLGDRVEIVPHMAQAALWERMGAADLLAHPCDYEGVSKIILEAMMLGLPVLASDVAPIPEYVREGDTGFRVANTPEAWADALAARAADKAALPAVSARARAYVEAEHDTGRQIDRYEAQFRHLLSTRGAAPRPPEAAGRAGGAQ